MDGPLVLVLPIVSLGCGLLEVLALRGILLRGSAWIGTSTVEEVDKGGVGEDPDPDPGAPKYLR